MLAIGGRYRALLQDSLALYTQEKILWLRDNPDVDKRLAGHADLSLFVGNGAIITAKGLYPYIVNSLTNADLPIIPSETQGTKYPADAGLCICRTGKYTIYNPKTADQQALPYLDAAKISVNQGYTRCSVCVVSNEGIITADQAIASRASESGLDVLKITPGHIFLEGYDYGFIGGASFMLSEDAIAFTGVLDEHPDKDRILAFLQKHGKRPVFLTKDPIFDIGGAVALP